MRTRTLRIMSAQINLSVGDIEANAARVIDIAKRASGKADLIVFPEMTLTGYPAEDLLLRPALYDRVKSCLADIQQQTSSLDLALVLGYPAKEINKTYNRLGWLQGGQIKNIYNKVCLPNHGVFDEMRYFTPGDKACVVEYLGHRIGLVICEDMWHQGPAAATAKAGADFIISINASPFDYQKLELREQTMQQRVSEASLPLLYVNNVGGQDQLVFDGGSLAFNIDLNKKIKIAWHAPYFKEDFTIIEYTENAFKAPADFSFAKPSFEARVYQALVLGTRDYITKNNFPGALLGLSGGIDSALALSIAADAIGAENVTAVMMPTKFTRDISVIDAEQMAKQLQVDFRIMPITDIFNSFLNELKDDLAKHKNTTAAENIQARCRGTMLMALSNMTHKIVIACGNKSELAVGYATLYGDMAGGFAIIKDLPKTMVYRLANYINSQGKEIIPQRIIDREPSAELAEDQQDSDSLPPYSELDDILQLYIEEDKSPQEIIKAGYDATTVNHVLSLVQRNEYKRRQAPPGVRITTRAFGKDRRYPITSGYFKINE